MKNLRTTVPDEVFDQMEADAVKCGRTLSDHVRRLLVAHHEGTGVQGATSSTEPVEARLDKQADAIRRLREDRDAIRNELNRVNDILVGIAERLHQLNG